MTQIYVLPLLRSFQGVLSKAVLIMGFIGLPFPPLVVAHGVMAHTITRAFLVKRFGVRSPRTHTPARETPRARSGEAKTEAHLGHHHTPRRHIHRHVRSVRGTTRGLVVLPRDCEEVSGEEATFYCDGVYYRAYYQGNDIVYVPEADIE